jgi:hypothetical protein
MTGTASKLSFVRNDGLVTVWSDVCYFEPRYSTHSRSTSLREHQSDQNTSSRRDVADDVKYYVQMGPHMASWRPLAQYLCFTALKHHPVPTNCSAYYINWEADCVCACTEFRQLEYVYLPPIHHLLLCRSWTVAKNPLLHSPFALGRRDPLRLPPRACRATVRPSQGPSPPWRPRGARGRYRGNWVL